MGLTTVVFAAVYAYGMLGALFGLSVWSFLTYQAVYFANPGVRWWAASLPAIPYSFLTVCAMAWVVAFRTPRAFRQAAGSRPLQWMVVILLVHYLLFPIAIAPEAHAKAVTEFTKLCVVVVLAFLILNSYRRIIYSLWMFGAGAAYIGWEAHVVGRNSGGRVEGIGMVDSPDANGFAAAIAPALAMVLVAMTAGTLRQKILAGALGVLVANGLVLVNSRGSFLAVIGGCTYVGARLFFSRTRHARQRLMVIMVLLAGVSGGLYLADDQFWSRMSTLQEIDDGTKSGSHRVEMWLATFPMVADYPLGVGVKGFHRLSLQYVDESLFATGTTQKAVHSSWFQALAETGWIGLAALFAMLAATVRQTSMARRLATDQGDLRARSLVLAIEGGLLTYLIAASFIDRYRAEVLYWFVLYGAAVYNVARNEAALATAGEARSTESSMTAPPASRPGLTGSGQAT